MSIPGGDLDEVVPWGDAEWKRFERLLKRWVPIQDAALFGQISEEVLNMTTTKPRPVGRPPGPRGRASRQVVVRISDAEERELEHDATARGISAAECLRRAYWGEPRKRKGSR